MTAYESDIPSFTRLNTYVGYTSITVEHFKFVSRFVHVLRLEELSPKYEIILKNETSILAPCGRQCAT